MISSFFVSLDQLATEDTVKWGWEKIWQNLFSCDIWDYERFYKRGEMEVEARIPKCLLV